MAVRFCDICKCNVKIPHLCSGLQKKKEQTLYGFWRYDLPPYILGGIIEEFKEDGYIKAKNYTGMKFKPIAILPDEAGAAALKLLDELQKNYRLEEAVLKNRFRVAGLSTVGLNDEAAELMAKKENKK